jgi:hypothetical protein
MAHRSRNALALAISGFLCRLLTLTGELIQAVATGRKFGFLDYQDRKAVLDRILKPAALANEMLAFQIEPRPARVHGAAEDFEKLRTYHQRNPWPLDSNQANGL